MHWQLAALTHAVSRPLITEYRLRRPSLSPGQRWPAARHPHRRRHLVGLAAGALAAAMAGCGPTAGDRRGEPGTRARWSARKCPGVGSGWKRWVSSWWPGAWGYSD